MISSKHLVSNSLAFRTVSRVPYCVSFTVAAKEKFCASPTGQEMFNRIDNDIVSTPVLRIEFGVRDDAGRYVDEFGVSWDRHIDADIGVPKPVITPDTLSQYPWPDPRAPGRFDELSDNIKRQPDKFHVMALDFSLYERAWSLRGLENLLLDFVEREDFVEAVLDKILEFNIAVIEAGLEACPELDAVYFGDDFGSQMGLIMGIDRWRKLIKPRLAKQYGPVRSAGKKVFIHSCGRVQDIFDDLVEIGVDCFNPFQPEVMDVYEIYNRYRGKLAFFGGISTQRLLPYGTVQQVEDEVDKLLAMGRNGGYVIAPAHSIPGDARPQNVHAMLDRFLNQDRI